MKALKIILGILAVLVVLFLILGLIQPNDFHFERYTNIDASKSDVFKHVNDVKAWEAWGPWMEDETIEITYGENTVGEGASYSWDSENSGSGDLTISESIPGESIKTDVNFGGGGPANGFWKFEDGENGGTKLTWGMDFTIPYPMNATAIFMNDDQMNSMYDTGLANIKELVEAEAGKTYNGFNVSEVDFPETNYITLRDNVDLDKIAAFFGQSYGKIGGALAGAGLEMQGHPSGIYYEMNAEANTFDMAAAMAVESGATVEGFENVNTDAGKALLIDHYGNYHGLGNAHGAMDEYMKEKGIEDRKLVIEEYVTDPGAEPDTSKWLTKVYYLLK